MAFTGGQQQFAGYDKGPNAGFSTKVGSMGGQGLGAMFSTGPGLAAATTALGAGFPMLAPAMPFVGGALGTVLGSFFEDEAEEVYAQQPPRQMVYLPQPQPIMYQFAPTPTYSLAQEYNVQNPYGFA